MENPTNGKIPGLRPAPFANGGFVGVAANHVSSFSSAVLYRMAHELLGVFASFAFTRDVLAQAGGAASYDLLRASPGNLKLTAA